MFLTTEKAVHFMETTRDQIFYPIIEYAFEMVFNKSGNLLEILQSTRFSHQHNTSNIRKIFHSPILFSMNEMILRVLNETNVDQFLSIQKQYTWIFSEFLEKQIEKPVKKLFLRKRRTI